LPVNGIYVLGNVVASAIAAAPVYVKVVEATSDGSGTFWPSSTVTAMKAGGGIVLAYLDCGWLENYRPYYATAVAAGIRGPLASPAWPCEFEVMFWSSTWHTICNNWTASAIAAGFDGIYLDVIDAWGDAWPQANVPATDGNAAHTPASSAAAMIDLIKDIGTTARLTNPNFLVYVNGGEELFSSPAPAGAYIAAINGMYKEQVLYDPNAANASNRAYEKTLLDNCKNAGKPVVLIEYVTGVTKVNDVKTTTASWGYGYYIANPNLNLSGVDTEGWTGIEG
jgi:cysteinyl-tRNA synthetase